MVEERLFKNAFEEQNYLFSSRLNSKNKLLEKLV
jgi:hypothetical protein